MKRLREEFIGRGEVKGFYFQQLLANEKCFLYKVTQPDVPKPHYEVFHRRVTTAHPKADSDERVEAYPKSNAFGLWAWTFPNEEKAMEKFNELESRV